MSRAQTCPTKQSRHAPAMHTVAESMNTTELSLSLSKKVFQNTVITIWQWKIGQATEYPRCLIANIANMMLIIQIMPEITAPHEACVGRVGGLSAMKATYMVARRTLVSIAPAPKDSMNLVIGADLSCDSYSDQGTKIVAPHTPPTNPSRSPVALEVIEAFCHIVSKWKGCRIGERSSAKRRYLLSSLHQQTPMTPKSINVNDTDAIELDQTALSSITYPNEKDPRIATDETTAEATARPTSCADAKLNV